MDKNSTILELRWVGKNPRIIYEDGEYILFYANGYHHTEWTVWQQKEGLKSFYREDADFHGNLWTPETDIGLCRWIQNVTLALEKNGISRNNMYLATREIFSMKDDPTDDKTINKILEILRKYFGKINGDFNHQNLVIGKDGKIITFGYNYVYKCRGIRDLIYLYLTGYAFHYGNCTRYRPENELFFVYRSLKYKDMFYRAIKSTDTLVAVNLELCIDIANIYYQNYQKIESIEQAIERLRNSIINAETGVEQLVTGSITEDRKKKIIEEIDKEITENKKTKEEISEKEKDLM